jgi:fructosamine-3-kinase
VGSSPTWLTALAERLGPVTERSRLGAGVWRITAGGRPYTAKHGSGVADEAAGLRQLDALPSAPPVPEVVHADEEVLVTSWVASGPRTPAIEVELGRTLAELHRSPYATWGGGSSFIGACRVTAAEQADAPTFYGHRLAELARAAHLERAVLPVVDRLDELLVPEGPALLHGDLWWGNVIWGADSRAWLIDPSVHGGHPEEDVAMLALFGPVPERLLDAYDEVRPLADGWRDRQPLFQLVPLLVHAVLFGGGYPSMVVGAAARYT